MNKKVLTTAIIINIFILLFFLVVKTCFGVWWAVTISNEKLVCVGSYLDTHIWVRRLVAFVFTLITYWFYLCACIKKWYIPWRHLIWLLPVLVGMQFVKIYEPTIGTMLDYNAMFLFPYLLRDRKSSEKRLYLNVI